MQGELLSPILFNLFVNDLELCFLKSGSLPYELSSLNLFLAGLHKVHPAYRMVNAGRAGVFKRVPTLCNQLLPHLLADIL
jgi:hypothetical protein